MLEFDLFFKSITVILLKKVINFMNEFYLKM